MFRVALLVSILLIQSASDFAAGYPLFSPDQKIKLEVTTGRKLEYAIWYGNDAIIIPSSIALHLNNGKILGYDAEVMSSSRDSVRNVLYPVVAVKNKEVVNAYNQLTINFRPGFSLVFRIYNDGVAYRFITHFKDSIKVESEEATFNFNRDNALLFPENKNFRTDEPKPYLKEKLSQVSSKHFSVLPLLVDLQNGRKMVITESDLVDYPGMYLRGNSNHTLSGKFPPARIKDTQYLDRRGWDRHVYITETAPYIAKTRGDRVFPWRAMIIADKDGDLLTNEMSYKLSDSNRIKDVSWIKPGKAVWDWWNNNNVTGVDFRGGVNTITYKYYIDFAAKEGLDYIVIDEGWYVLGNLLKVVPDMDMNEIISYANEKKIGVFLWVAWKTLDQQLDPAMDQFSAWGIKGLKVDFMELDDQMMINNYYKIAREAANRKLMVEFHGSSKPDGISGPYPNVLTRDLAPGLEFNKWEGRLANPEMAVTLPFIRMLAGPMDYTPGAMVNATQADYAALFNNPMSLGTRCQQMAMFVVFESPLTVMADNASQYLKEQECTAFISKIPTTWDKTVALDARVGDYIVLSRKKGNDWWLAAMTDWDPRTINIKLDFLENENYTVEFFRDGINADRNATDYKRIIRNVRKGDSLNISMAPGGGWVGHISPQ